MRTFDGVNDNLLSANNALAGLDVAQKSYGFWIVMTADPTGDQTVVALMTADGAGNNRPQILVTTPVVSGFRLQFRQAGTTTGIWISPDITSNVAHHLAVTYDRGSTANDPVFYVDGVSVTVTESTTPVGMTTGEDTLKCGENSGGTNDFAGSIAHLCIDVGILWTVAQVNRARRWGRPHGGVLVYHPFLTDKLADEGAGAETLTATGTTMSAGALPVIRPGSSVLTGGGGW